MQGVEDSATRIENEDGHWRRRWRLLLVQEGREDIIYSYWIVWKIREVGTAKTEEITFSQIWNGFNCVVAHGTRTVLANLKWEGQKQLIKLACNESLILKQGGQESTRHGEGASGSVDHV